jgi:hypothetical protein
MHRLCGRCGTQGLHLCINTLQTRPPLRIGAQLHQRLRG